MTRRSTALKTDSEKSDDEHYEPVHTKLGMVNEHSAFEDPEEEVKVEETTVNPLEQATVHEPDEPQNLLQEQVVVQVQKEDDSILQKRKRNVEQMTDSDMSLFGADIAAFLNAKKAKKRAKTGLKEAKVAYDKACADLEDLRANFNAAFESSAENNE